jgi:hypothetical protein
LSEELAVERNLVWLFFAALAGLGLWAHVEQTNEINSLKTQLRIESGERTKSYLATSDLIEKLNKKSELEHSRLSAALDSSNKQIEISGSIATRNDLVLSSLYDIKYTAEGRPKLIVPKDTESGIGVK